MNHTNRTANGALVSAAEIARMKGNYPQPTPRTPPPTIPCIEAQSWDEVAALVAQYLKPPKGKRMQDLNEIEIGALDYAGKQAAAFIESIAKTDLATFSAQDWQMMVQVACKGYVDHIVRTRAMANDAANKVITDADVPY